MARTPARLGVAASCAEYREAAKEHVERLERLHALGFFSLSHYIAGVSVECILRAHRVLVDPEFDARHDLELLARSGRFFEFIPEGSRERVTGALATVALRWSNDYRYRSSTAILKRLKAARLDRRVKGDPLKYSSAVIVSSAVEIVTTGLVRWRASPHR